jgi:type I restriction enzyme, S subunit
MTKPGYKPTELGEIPLEWEIKRLEEIASLNMGQSPESRDVNGDGVGLPFLQGNADFGEWNPVPRFWCTYPKKLVEKDDVLISVRAPVGAVNVADRDFCIGRGLAGIKFFAVNKLFGLYSVQNNVHQFNSVKQGSAFDAINKDDLANLKIPSPKSLLEQRRIAEVLSSVDDLMLSSRRVLEQLREVRRGVMQRLLTRGIPGRHTAFRETELGKIPLEWEVKKLKDVARKITDGSHQPVKATSDGDIPFLYISCIEDGEISWNKALKITRKTYEEISKGRKPKTGIILYTAVGSYGNAALVRENVDFSFQRHIAFIDPDNTIINSEFLVNWLNSSISKAIADKVAMGNAQKTVTLFHLGQFTFAMPSLEEQERIVTIISSFDQRIVSERARLEALEGLKAGLMQHLLTGKLRVPVVKEVVT